MSSFKIHGGGGTHLYRWQRHTPVKKSECHPYTPPPPQGPHQRQTVCIVNFAVLSVEFRLCEIHLAFLEYHLFQISSVTWRLMALLLYLLRIFQL